MKKYDVIVIGSGGGSKITRPAANLGYNVAIIEKDQLGGTCLNRGCIPSKMLIHPADIIRELQDANRFDLTIDTSFKFDAKKFVSDVNKEINEESQSIEPLYEAHKNVTYYNDTASFEKDYVLRVGDHTITAPKIFIAAGARPNIPNYKGLQNTPYWTSTEALKATSLPKSLIIFGGGYIACELGHYFSALGVKVTFLLRSELIFSHDDDIKYEFTRMVRRYSDVIEFAVVNEVSYKENCFSVFFTDKDGGSKTLQANQLLVATGIIPNSDTLSLENTSIECDENGYINVNDYLETASKGIYSFGDIIGKYFFRHTANFEGQYLFDTVFKKDPSGKTLLHHASFNGNNEAVKLLIKKGASTAIRDSTFNFNVIDWARAGTITQFMLLDDKIKTNNNFIEVFEEFKHVSGIKDIQLLQTRILWKKKWAIKYKYQTIEKISSIQRLDDMEWKLIHSSLFNPFNKLNIFTDIYYDKDLIVIKNILINHQQKLFKNTLSSSIPNNFW